MSKLILLGLIIAFIYFFILPKFRKNKNDTSDENFVQCDECLTFVNIKEAVLKDGKYVCQECIKGQKCR